ncbi:hypothetical protein Poli38472_010052 [Pythium oligandrum]|uniref:U-box domain-containing protein n=1 Tax=Pythium oligandrum TaxID=41045 RepID=A0A8K1C971_PYTOL|nr:hypothetical protein Poli38472_010052 [Pythium oligandrum]|eukprot:TMW58493.1 hypothetical protein Poli38472_010052 [Pythium oligandrum]
MGGGDAMVQGLDPRYVRFPDMYRLYDFHVGPKKHQQRSFQGGQMILFVRSPDDDELDSVQAIQVVGDDGEPITNPKGKEKEGAEEDETPKETNADFVVLYVSGDKIVLDKATLNQPNNDGWTPLHACCHTQNAQEAGITILKELVDRKADLSLVTRRGPGSFACGFTPLHIAVAYGLEALALKLIRAGANVNTKNTIGWTPLYDACHRGYTSVARELLKAGAKHDVICPEFALCPYPGQYPLAEAARQGAVDTVKALLEWGVDKNAVNTLGWTAMHEAAYHNRVGVVKLLIVYGADVLIKTKKGSLARDVTISSEIRGMLEDITTAALAAASPKREKTAIQDGSGDVEAEKPSSPKKSPAKTVPLSRKEEYTLLGDLPNLEARSAAPTIAIKDADDAADDEDGKADDEDVAEPSTASTTKHKKKRKHKKHGREVPPEYKCAVTLKLLKDPLRSPYGQVFEREVLEAWFRDFGNRCPLTGQPLSMAEIIPDDKLRAEIRNWKRGTRKLKEGGQDITPSEAKGEAKMPDPVAAAADDPYDF